MSTLKLLQATDLHLQVTPDTTYQAENPEQRWQQVCAHMSQHAADADLLILSGDLVHHAGEVAYQRLKQDISQLPMPTVWLPGNHDDTAQMLVVGDAQLNRKQLVLGRWQVLLLDSTAEPDGRGSGALAETELAFLRQQLVEPQAEFILIALHHNPVSVQSRWQDAIKLQNADAFWEVVSTSERVKGVIFGHVHQHWLLTHQGVPLFSAPSVAPAFKAHADEFQLESDPILNTPAYLEYSLADTGQVSVNKIICPADTVA